VPIEEVLTTLAGGKRGKTDEKWREIDQKTGVIGCGVIVKKNQTKRNG